MGRWAWRLFRREWRQQLLVLSLLAIAVAVTVLGLGLASNASSAEDARFGNADYLLSFPSTNPTFAQDLTAASAAFDVSESVYHSHIAVPGSVTPIDVRAQDPAGPLSSPTLQLTDGAWPTGPDDIALTDGVMATFGLKLGDVWTTEDHDWHVVGVVENPLDLVDDFAVSAPAAPAQFDTVTVWGTAAGGAPDALNIPGAKLSVRSSDVNAQAEVVTLALAAVGAIFVGLVAVAGFAVVAQRRLRGLGMLGALGATARQTRFALVANGAIVGLAGAAAGVVLGIVAWWVAAPGFEQAVNHRIDRTNLPWPAVVAVGLLAIATSIVGSWWPARAAARTPIVSALALRPPPPRSAHVLGVPGALLMIAGLAAIGFTPTSRPAIAALGVAATAVGMLLVAPLGLPLIGAATNHAPVAIRLAIRDLVRYRARSGGSVAAVSLAVAIAVAVSVSAGAAQVSANAAASGGNLPDNQLALWLGPSGAIGPVPALLPAQIAATQSAVGEIVSEIGATSSLELGAAVDPNAHGGIHVGDSETAGMPTYDPVQLGLPQTFTEDGKTGTTFDGRDTIAVFVSSAQILDHYGIAADSIAGDVDLVTSHDSLDAYEAIPIRAQSWDPVVQNADLPTYSSTPTTLITQKAMDSFGLISVPTGWILTFDQAMTPDQRDQARVLAAKAGLSAELRPTEADLSPLRIATTTGGVALALAVLAMTVGLIRSETSGDLSTLAATGASSRVRREITAATAAALGLVGAVFGTATAYLGLIVWHRHDLSVLVPVPAVQLCIIVLGLPVIAWLVGWLLGGREPYLAARRSID